MKKILFLLMVCIIKLNAYEYLIYEDLDSTGINEKLLLVFNNLLRCKNVWNDGHYSYDNNLMISFNNIKFRSTNSKYITSEKFYEYYSKDFQFLNDLYTKTVNVQYFLNYLYNDSPFNASNYINYTNYELLYNSDGLVVESIVNDKWAGLYDGPDKSGRLYDEKGDLKYINGVPVSFFESSFDKLMRRFGVNLQSIFTKKIFYPLLVLIFACVVLRSVIRMAFKAFLIRFYDKKIGQYEKRRENIENA